MISIMLALDKTLATNHKLNAIRVVIIIGLVSYLNIEIQEGNRS